MKFTKLFEPVRINSLVMKNRLLMPAMVTNFANRDNTVSDRLIAYHRARTKGGFGLNTTEAVAVHLLGRGFDSGLGLWDDRFIEGFSRLTKAIHDSGGKIVTQIFHAGAQTTAKVIGTQPVAPSALLHPIHNTLPRELRRDEILEIIEAFGQAARRAREAGFDGVEVHASHGYLISQFMSTYTNRRTDEYGGDLSGRLRMPVEVLKSIRRQAGADFPVIIRMAGEERVSDGRKIEETKMAVKLLDEAGYDAFHITSATTATLHYIAPPSYADFALNVPYAEQVKKVTSKPVITTGRIHDPYMAEMILFEGRADIIGMGRSSLADPELPNKILAGALDGIRPCVACLQGCIGHLYLNEPITCLANLDVGREGEVAPPRATAPKKILVAGGGPAGLEASRMLALRGHKVILCEKTEKLGGQLLIASMAPHRQAIAQLLKQMIRAAQEAGVEIRPGTTVTGDLAAEMNPDLVIVATGGKPITPSFPGECACRSATAWDVLAGKVQMGKKILVIGGGSVGCETADFLVSQGKKVTLVEMREDIGLDLVPRVRFFLMPRLNGVDIKVSSTVCETCADGAVVECQGETKTLDGYDDVVWALGTKSENSLVSELASLQCEVIAIGDSAKIGDALSAMQNARELGASIS
jgi:2,4-dienoyl-CoA reductase-like NADH-dependent reductase (Old Yellow Enzyme family)/thioredoxin reductase